MPTFAIRARFPLRQFNAVDHDGEPEWPPSPARLAAALLSAAHDAGTPEVAESLFSLTAPRIYAPRVGSRRVSFSHWVPVNNGLEYGDDGRATKPLDVKERFQSLAQEPADRGVILGSAHDTVTWVFEDGAEVVDTHALAEVARTVPYLGRPTSPIILEVIPGETAPPQGYLEWRPVDDGDTEIGVADLLFLEALNRREEERRRSPVTGSHPPIAIRPTAHYRCIGGPGIVGQPQAEPSLVSWRALMDRAQLVRFPAGQDPRLTVQASEAVSIVSQLQEQMDHLDFVIPVFGTAGFREVPVLRGVIVAGTGPGHFTFATHGGLKRVPAEETRRLRSLPRLMRVLTDPRQEWTTLVPTLLSDQQIETQLREVATQHGVRVGSICTHPSARAIPVPNMVEPSPGRHVSVRFSASVAGPIVLDRVWLAPAGSTVTVNPRQR